VIWVETHVEIRLPDLGDIEEVRVVAWLADAGESVGEGDDLVEVETEKTTFVVPAPVAGRIEEIAAAVGATIERGGLLGRIERSA
jgi:pyruvate/2-oxoglutarate dehydrogenase complex dihydrolipoamide acyltransferase (E2) component